MAATDIIADLDQRVKALERQSGAANEALQPTYLTVASNGTVSANFTGHVHAQGLDLDAGTNATPPSQDRVRWLRVSDGAVTADIAGTSAAATEFLLMDVYALAAADGSLGRVVAFDDFQVPQARLEVQQTARGTTSSVTARAGGIVGFLRTLIDQAGQSDFLQLASTQKLQLNIGHTTTNWGGASSFSIPVTVAHGLGNAPAAFVAFGDGPATDGSSFYMFSNQASDATNIYVRANTTTGGVPAANVAATFRWLAIG